MDTTTLGGNEADEDRNHLNSGVAATAPEGVSEAELAEELKERAHAQFLDGLGVPKRSGKPAALENPTDLTLLVVKVAKTTVHDMHVASSTEVKESWGEMLDEMEALAYLVGDHIGRMLVAEEARPIGRELERQLKAAKGEVEKLRGNAAARRSKARKAAEKDEAKAAGLDERLAGIDEELAASRAAVYARKVKAVPWPAMQSVIADVVERKPRAAVDQLARLRADAERAEAAAARADADAVAARRRVERANGPLVKLQALRAADASACETDEEAWQQLLQNRALLDEEYEQRSVKVEELQSAWRTAELAASNARDSATAAREEVAAEAAVRACREAQATRASELRGQWEAERAQLVAQKAAWAEEDAAELAALEAERVAMRARHAAERAEILSRESLHWESPAETRARLHMGAKHVWGSAESSATVAAPKVFKLTGMSVEEIRGRASEVSQMITGTEERVALNRAEVSFR